MHNNQNFTLPILNIAKNNTIIIGFSGGPDSLYLLLCLKKMEQSHNLKLIAAHIDHEWRKESATELLWCKQLCASLNIEFASNCASKIITNKSKNGSLEQLGRNIRRAFFEEVSNKYCNSLIALAHHKDDQIETFFIKLARGASLQGLSGIKEKEKNYIHPILHISKQEILQYLNDNKIEYIQDPTNNDCKFLRNKIRHQLIPTMQTIDSRFQINILKAMKHLESVNYLLDQLTIKTITEISTTQSPLMLNINSFLSLHEILQQKILLYLIINANATFVPSQALLKEIFRFLKSTKKSEHLINQTYKIKKTTNSFGIIAL